jgi:hypothetical protein
MLYNWMRLESHTGQLENWLRYFVVFLSHNQERSKNHNSNRPWPLTTIFFPINPSHIRPLFTLYCYNLVYWHRWGTFLSSVTQTSSTIIPWLGHRLFLPNNSILTIHKSAEYQQGIVIIWYIETVVIRKCVMWRELWNTLYTAGVS